MTAIHIYYIHKITSACYFSLLLAVLVSCHLFLYMDNFSCALRCNFH